MKLIDLPGWLLGSTLMIVAATAGTAEDLEESAGGKPVIAQAFARATFPGSGTGVVYMTIANPLDHAITLMGATGDRAGSIHLHETRLTEDMMKMRSVKPLQLAAGSKVILEPGGLHFMMMGLAKPLVQGEVFRLYVQFADPDNATTPIEVEVEVLVGSVAAMAYPSTDRH